MTESEHSCTESDSSDVRVTSTLPSPPDLPDPLRPALPFADGYSRDARPHLVGRELELARVRDAIDRTILDRSATLVTLSGPSGMGKTRLIRESLVLAGGCGFEDRFFSLAAFSQDPSGALIARLLRARFGLEGTTDPELQRQILQAKVSEVLHDDRVGDVCFFLGKLLGFEAEKSPLSRCLNRDSFYSEVALESILCELFSVDAEQAPICLVFEDLQHADTDSLALLGALLDALLDSPRCSALVLCSAQPDFFAKHAHFTRFSPEHHEHLELRPLEVPDATALMQQILGDNLGSNDERVQRAMEVAHGNPGLIECYACQLWYADALAGENAIALRSFHPRGLPHFDGWDELPEVLQTRVYSLSENERSILEAAAVVGTACWQGLLAHLTCVQTPGLQQTACDELHAGLARLISAGHLLELPESRISGDIEYVFRSPGERETVLRQLWMARRKAYHRATAEWLGARHTDDSGSEIMALEAHHLAEAGSAQAAAKVYFEAGTQARLEGSRTQSAEYFERGLDALADRDGRRRIDALHSYGSVLVELGKPTLAEGAFAEMLRLAEKLGLAGKCGAALNRLGRIHRESGELTLARRYLERARAAFELAGDGRGLSATKDDLGKLLWLEGDHVQALPWLCSSFEERSTFNHRRSLAVSLTNLALAWQDGGNARTAQEALELAQQFFGQERDVGGCCDTLLALGRLATQHHDLARAHSSFEYAISIATLTQDRPRLAKGLLHLGETKLRNDDVSDTEPLLDRAAGLAEEMQAWLDLAEAKRALAKLQLKLNRLRDARQNVRVSLHLARRCGSRAQLAATLRTLAEIAAAGAWGPSEAERAVRYYMRAIELAKEIHNDRELAKGYRSFARYAERYDNPAILAESATLRGLSEEIFNRAEARA